VWFIEAEQYSAFFARVLNQPHMRYFSVGIVLFKKIFCVWFIEAEQPSAFFFARVLILPYMRYFSVGIVLFKKNVWPYLKIFLEICFL